MKDLECLCEDALTKKEVMRDQVKEGDNDPKVSFQLGLRHLEDLTVDTKSGWNTASMEQWFISTQASLRWLKRDTLRL